MTDIATLDDIKTPAEFLSEKEMEILTGYKRVKSQRKWLDAEGIQYFVPHGGARVIVLRDWLRRFNEPPAPRPIEPNFAALG